MRGYYGGRGAAGGQPDLRVHETLGGLPGPLRGGTLQGPALGDDAGQGGILPAPLPQRRALDRREGGGARAPWRRGALRPGGGRDLHPQERPLSAGELRADRPRDRVGPGGRIFGRGRSLKVCALRNAPLS